MPIKYDEAKTIISLTQEYLTKEKTTELFIRLDEVMKTSNKQLQESLTILRRIVDPIRVSPPWWFSWCFRLVVAIHIGLVIGFVVAFLILPFYTGWYVALPLMTFMFFFVTTRQECQITNLENYMRQKLGMKRIGGFVGHYLIRPGLRVIKKKI